MDEIEERVPGATRAIARASRLGWLFWYGFIVAFLLFHDFDFIPAAFPLAVILLCLSVALMVASLTICGRLVYQMSHVKSDE